MAYPDIPAPVKNMLAIPAMRWRHRYWHWVKNERFVTHPANTELVQALADIGWSAALTGEPGSGLDFLFMHRMMIENVDAQLAAAGDPDWPRVIGWDDIPAAPDDPDWPEPHVEDLDDPAAWPTDQRLLDYEGIAEARSAAVVSQNLERAQILRSEEFLTRDTTTLDRYGFLLEVTVHNWMHMRYSATPPLDGDALDAENDYLGAPFSSHVNPYFWKLHGWIDDCIGLWEEANDAEADFSTAWRAPEDAPPEDELLPPGAPLVAAIAPSPEQWTERGLAPFAAPASLVAQALGDIHAQ